MKSVHYIYSILFLFLLTACSEEETAPMMQQAGTFSIEVSDGGFLSVEPGTATRAVENGYQTVFTNGDKLGLIVTGSSGELVIDNKPFTFDGGKWTDAAGNLDITYDASYNYLVYYPYSETMNGKKTADEIKAVFVPKADQRNYADYTASDLMIGSGTFNQAHNVLKVTLQHVMTLLVLAPQNTFEVNGQTYSWASEYASTGSFTIDDKVYVPWQSDTKEMRLLLPESVLLANKSVRYYYLYNDDKKAGSANVSTGQEGKYQQVVPETIAYTLASGAVYYADGTTLPYAAGYAESSPVGIVYWAGSEAYNDDPLLKERHPGCNHGLAVALHDAGDGGMYWSTYCEIITTSWVNKDGNPYKNKVNLQASDKWCGYSNTLALTDYNAGMYGSRVSTYNSYRVLPIDALQEYAAAHPAPANSSGWYFPSVTELKNVCWGQGSDNRGTAGKDMLNAQLAKVGGTFFPNDYYWSSTEGSRYSDYAWYVDFGYGYVHDDGYKYYITCRVRPLFAF